MSVFKTTESSAKAQEKWKLFQGSKIVLSNSPEQKIFLLGK